MRMRRLKKRTLLYSLLVIVTVLVAAVVVISAFFGDDWQWVNAFADRYGFVAHIKGGTVAEAFFFLLVFIGITAGILLYENIQYGRQAGLSSSAFLERLKNQNPDSDTSTKSILPKPRTRAAKRQRNARWKAMQRYGDKHAPPRPRPGSSLKEFIYRTRSR